MGRIVRRFLIPGFLLLLVLPLTAVLAEGEGGIIEELKLFSKMIFCGKRLLSKHSCHLFIDIFDVLRWRPKY